MSAAPYTLDDVHAAEARIRPFVPVTPLRDYPLLDAAVGDGIRVLVKHENFNPTGSFKVRNGVSFMTALAEEQRARGVVAATRGNHGLGIAFAARAFGTSATICVPIGNNPEKNAAMRALGARVVEQGRDYDESVHVAAQVVRDEGAALAHSTNDANVLAGAATLSLEMAQQDPSLDAVVVAVGGGSQAVGAITVARALRPGLKVYGVQASGAAACHDGWHLKRPHDIDSADTFADGLATRSTYDMTFPTLLEGLEDFVTVSDAEIADAVRTLMQVTHSMVEGAGAAGFAALLKLRERLADQRVAVIASGANIDDATLKRVLARDI